MKDLTLASELDSKDDEVFYWRALVYYQMDLCNDALADIHRALAIKPDDVGSLRLRFDIFMKLCKEDEARKDLDKILLLDPKNVPALVDKGRYFFHKDDFHEAINYLSQALAQDPMNKIALKMRADAYFGVKEMVLANKDVDAALEIDPTNAVTWAFRASCRLKISNIPDAIEAYTKAIALNPHYKLALKNRAILHIQTGDYETALRDLSSLYQIDPDLVDLKGNMDHPAILTLRSVIYSNNGKKETANQCIQAAFKANKVLTSKILKAVKSFKSS